MASIYSTAIKGNKDFGAIENEGANYYAFSPTVNTTQFTEVFANIKLPNASGGDVVLKSKRNAYFSLGVYGSVPDKINTFAGVDFGVSCTDGVNWQPAVMDTLMNPITKKKYNEQFYTNKSGPNTTNAIITVTPYSDHEVDFYVRFVNASGQNTATPFWKRIDQLMPRTSWVRYYRFASLPQYSGNVDNQTDGTQLLNGKFTNLGIYNTQKKNSNGAVVGGYEQWGIWTNYVEHAHVMYAPRCWVPGPEVSTSGEAVNIRHT